MGVGHATGCLVCYLVIVILKQESHTGYDWTKECTKCGFEVLLADESQPTEADQARGLVYIKQTLGCHRSAQLFKDNKFKLSWVMKSTATHYMESQRDPIKANMFK